MKEEDLTTYTKSDLPYVKRKRGDKIHEITEVSHSYILGENEEWSSFEEYKAFQDKAIADKYIQASKNGLKTIVMGESKDELELITVKDAIEKGIPPIEYVIDPFLRKGGLTIIGGEPGAKKSLLSMMFSICIAKGKPLFDKFQCNKAKVCYLDFENGYAVMVNRYNSLLKGNFSGDGTSMSNTEDITLSIFNDLKLDLPQHKNKLKAIIEQTNADVFIIDSLVRCMDGEEDKSTDVRRVFDNLKDFMAAGKSFVVLHHTRKDNQRGMMGLRGSSDLGGMAEIVLMLKGSGHKAKFTNVELAKHRHLGIEATKDWGFMIDDDCFGKESNFLKLLYYEKNPEEQDAITQCYDDVLSWLNESKVSEFRSKKAIEEMDRFGHKKNTIYSTLYKLVEDKILQKGGKRGIWIVK